MAGKPTRVDRLRQLADGRWLSIFQALCPGLFDEAIHSLGKHVTCPFHGGKDDFRFLNKASKRGGSTEMVGAAMCTCDKFPDGFAVLHRALNCTFTQMLDELEEYLCGRLAVKGRMTPAAPKVEVPAENAAELIQKARRLFFAAKRPREYTYYLNRGIPRAALQGLQNVKLMPKLGYYDIQNKVSVKTGDFPAYIAGMQDSKDDFITVHRTYLSHDERAKANVPSPKKLGRVADGRSIAVRLYDAKNTKTLGIGEGIETMIGVRALSMLGYWPDISTIPTWSCYSEANIRNFQIPEWLSTTLERLVIFADSDASGTGYRAATQLRDRLKTEYPELIVDIRVPVKVGDDWLDVLVDFLN